LPWASRGSSAVAMEDHSIYVFGGYTASPKGAAGQNATFGLSAHVLVYDIATDTCQPVTPLPFPVLGVEFVLNGRSFYGAGGEAGMRGRLTRVLEGRPMEPAR